MMFLTPIILRAVTCSLVCGCGHLSLAEIIRSAPSMMDAPESIVLISASWPGASTKEAIRRTAAGDPQCSQVSFTV